MKIFAQEYARNSLLSSSNLANSVCKQEGQISEGEAQRSKTPFKELLPSEHEGVSFAFACLISSCEMNRVEFNCFEEFFVAREIHGLNGAVFPLGGRTESK